jgi:hypothetical protein
MASFEAGAGQPVHEVFIERLLRSVQHVESRRQA